MIRLCAVERRIDHVVELDEASAGANSAKSAMGLVVAIAPFSPGLAANILTVRVPRLTWLLFAWPCLVGAMEDEAGAGKIAPGLLSFDTVIAPLNNNSPDVTLAELSCDLYRKAFFERGQKIRT